MLKLRDALNWLNNLRVDEIMQKQALQEAFETERNLLLKEIATLQKRATTAKSQTSKMAKTVRIQTS